MTWVIIFTNRAGSEIVNGVDLTKGEARVYSWGGIALSVAHNLQTTSTVDLRNFPLDNQTCTITYFIPMPLDDFKISKGMIDTTLIPSHLVFEENSEWHSVETELSDWNLTMNAPGRKEIHSAVNVTITMKRVPTFYIVYLVIPSVVISFVSVMVFALPPESGERIGLSITSLLSYTVFLLMVSEVSEVEKTCLYWVRRCFFLISATWPSNVNLR